MLAKAGQLESAAAEEEQTSSDNLQEESGEGSGVMEKEPQAKMMSVFEQVRNQIRSQEGLKAPKSSMMELVSKLKAMETGNEQMVDGDNIDAEEEREAEAIKVGCKVEIDSRIEMLSKTFEEKLEASNKALSVELEVQISAVRKEMQAYTDQTLKDLRSKITSSQRRVLQPNHSKAQPEGADAETKRRASAATSLPSTRGKVLTRTLTTTIIIPKTPAPVISGSQAKLKSPSKGRSLQVRDHVLSLSGNKSCHGRGPLPPAQPLLPQRRKCVQAKGKAGK